MLALTRCVLILFKLLLTYICIQTHKFYGDQKHDIEDKEFADDIQEFYKNDRKLLLKGHECSYFFFSLRSYEKLSSTTFSDLFASTMVESVGKSIKPQVPYRFA